MPSVRAAATAGLSEYERDLTAAWAEHLAPRQPDAPTVISLFAGCGGSSLGYSMAGFRELLAVEWDSLACQTFRANFPDVPVHEGDVCGLDGAEALRLAGIAPGQLDVLDGSPPCQGFSTSGKRQLNDSRNDLYREYVRLLQELRPRAFVMENVSGLVKGRMKSVFAAMLRELKACGYRCSVRLLIATSFGVPQSRERLIFIGIREDLGLDPSHPLPTINRARTASEALAGLTLCPLELEKLRDAARRYKSYRSWALIPQGSNLQKVKGGSGGDFSAVKHHPHRPAFTIMRNDCNIAQSGSMHWEEPRRFTTGEYKRFMSFPDPFHFPGGWKANVAQLGNAVPPLMMRAVARHLASVLGTLGTS